jgi:imidazolonepropionase
MSRLQLFYNFQRVQNDFNGLLPGYAMLVRAGRISWIGPLKSLPKVKLAPQKINLKNQKILPSFIECHTHSVFAGSRADEFELRNTGMSYLEIAARGGGILSTVTQTRAASEKKLLKIAQERINHFMRQGVSTVEIKSGYGLDAKTEIKMLTVANKLKGARIVTTYLGAHAKPKEFKSYEKYLDDIIKNTLPILKKKNLANRVDIFIEKNFFEKNAGQKYLAEFQKQGFDITIHANQLSQSGGAELALQLNAKSADHVIQLSDDTIQNFGKSKVVAVLLPAADLYMKCDYPPARKLIDAGATVALATDFNPGTSPTQDLMLVGLLARLKMGMTLPEVFKAYTINAARALGIEAEEGSLEVGKQANFICTEADLTDFFYSAGAVPKHRLFIGGVENKF